MAKKKKKDKFSGPIEDLKDIIRDLGISGYWEEEKLNCNHPSIKYRFRGKNHEVLNWWDRTKTLSFQGKNKENFREILLPHLEKSRATLDKFLS